MKPPTPWNSKKEQPSAVTDTNITHSRANTFAVRYWKTWAALLVIFIATFTGWYVAWSLLFIFWIVHSAKNKELFFVEKVEAKEAPFTFWTTLGCWLIVAIYMIWEFAIASF